MPLFHALNSHNDRHGGSGNSTHVLMVGRWDRIRCVEIILLLLFYSISILTRI